MPTAKEIAEARLQNVDAAIRAAQDTGLPLHVAFALLDMESEGRNFFGSDAGGMYKGLEVTEAKYKNMVEKVLAGAPSNGVGPTQITWAGAKRADGTRSGGFFTQAAEQGLKLWIPYDNMLFGFRLVAAYAKTYNNDWFQVGKRYNGKDSYGTTFKRVVGEWKARLEGADEEEIPVATWHLAPSLKQLQKELDAQFPGRPNDGTIGDAAHAARPSEHNPDNDPDPMPKGAVSAIDVYTQDGKGKTWITEAEFAKLLAKFKKDSRVWYVIHRGFIYSRTHNFEKRAYDGSNPHNSHFHLSLMQTKAAHDSTASWGVKAALGTATPTPPSTVLKPLPTLSKGDKDATLVPFLKRYFWANPPNQDSVFGTGLRAKVVAYQEKNRLTVDGVVGKQTWAKIVAGGTKLPAGYKLP